ncbi:MAG: DUF3078 domain-containing protein [candidate division KSB1 bacterium]
MLQYKFLRLTTGLLCATFLTVAAQEKKEEKFGWAKTLVGALNLTQNRYSSNWTKGGENSVAWKGVVETKWEDNAVKTNWKNSGKLVFGQIKQGDDGIRKSDDELNVESVLTYKVGSSLNPYLSFNGLTQIASGFDYPNEKTKVKVSSSFSPMFLRQSLGLGYKPNDKFVTRLGVSVKETIVRDAGLIAGSALTFRERYGNKPNESVRVETGIESTTDLSVKLAENILFKSKLELFSSFENFNTADVAWDNTLTAKISKYFSVNFNVYAFYDEDILTEVQVKQALAFGLTYTFF